MVNCATTCVLIHNTNDLAAPKRLKQIGECGPVIGKTRFCLMTSARIRSKSIHAAPCGINNVMPSYEHWKGMIKPMGLKRLRLPFSVTISLEEAGRASAGLLPESMD